VSVINRKNSACPRSAVARGVFLALLGLVLVGCDTGDNAGVPSPQSDSPQNGAQQGDPNTPVLPGSPVNPSQPNTPALPGSPVNPSQPNTPVTGGDPAIGGNVTADTAQIQQTAENLVTQGVNMNFGGIESLSNDASLDLDQDSLGGQLLSGIDMGSLGEFDRGTSDFINNTLGIDDPNAIVIREGNVITIDPDEAQICADEIPFLQAAGFATTNCELIMSELRVELTAQTNESGTILYSFQNDTVMSVAYAQNAASYVLQLDGLQVLAERAQLLNGISPGSNGSMSGALRLSTVVTNDQPGAESGSIKLEVTEAISVTDVNTGAGAESLTIQPSTVVDVTINEATGDVITQLNWGALQIMTDISAAGDGSSIAQLDLAGLTANAVLNANSSVLSLDNVSIGNAPLTVNINQVNSVRMNLSAFDVTLDAEQNLITFDGALGASIALNNLMGLVEGFGPETVGNVSVNAGAGTRLRDQGDGITRVEGSGPFSISVNASDNGITVQQNLDFNAGECFASDDSGGRSLVGIATVSCSP